MTRRSLLARVAMTLAGNALAPSVAAAHRVEPRGSAAQASFLPLTPRQGKIAQLVARGNSSAEIATQLGASTRTVQCQVQWIVRKLELQHRSDIGVWVARQRIRALLGIRA